MTEPVILVGFMGSGKSTIGRRLAERLGVEFRDLDARIEAREGRTIASFFDQEGEAFFRELESRSLAAELSAGGGFVLALGGGAFAQERNRALLAGHDTVWLDCPFELVAARVARETNRPLARDPERFARLFAERRPLYALAKHRVAVISDDPDEAVTAILHGLTRPE